MADNNREIKTGDYFKSLVAIRYEAPGRGINHGQVQGKVVSFSADTVEINDFGNIFLISRADYETENIRSNQGESN